MDIRGYPLIRGGFQTWVLVRIWGGGWGRVLIHEAGDGGLSPAPASPR